MIPPGGLPTDGGPPPRFFAWDFAVGVLARETALGALLWVSAPSGRSPANLALSLIGLAAAVAWTRWRGMILPRCWARALTEGALLYVGAMCFANLLLTTLGPVAWPVAWPGLR